MHIARVDYATPSREYTQTDCPSHTDCVKNMIAGPGPMDGAVLVVAATDGVMPETREQVRLARQTGVPYILVFLNKCDLVDDEETPERVETEVRSLLTQYDFPGDDTPCVRGSALKALEGDAQWEEAIVEFTGLLDNYLPDPQPPLDKPFLMPVEGVLSPPGDGTSVTGTIEQGTLRLREEITVVGGEETVRATCTHIERSGTPTDRAVSSDTCTVSLEGVQLDGAASGLVLAKPGSINPHTQFEAEIYLLTPKEGGRDTPVHNGDPAQIRIRTAEVTGTIELAHDADPGKPGHHTTVNTTLSRSAAMDDGLRFTIHEDGRTVGAGMMSKILA